MQEPHKIVREVLRHYLELEQHCQNTGTWTFEYGDYVISFLDLQGCLKNLSPRKKEAVYYNVIMDWKQAKVADLMGIKTVTVGQYVEQACCQIEQRILKTKEQVA